MGRNGSRRIACCLKMWNKKSASTDPEIGPLQSKLCPSQKSRSRRQMRLYAATQAGVNAESNFLYIYIFLKLSVTEASLARGGGIATDWGCVWGRSSLNLTTSDWDRASTRWFCFPGIFYAWNRMLWFRQVKTSHLKKSLMRLSVDDCLLIICTSASLSVYKYVHLLASSRAQSLTRTLAPPTILSNYYKTTVASALL